MEMVELKDEVHEDWEFTDTATYSNQQKRQTSLIKEKKEWNSQKMGVQCIVEEILCLECQFPCGKPGRFFHGKSPSPRGIWPKHLKEPDVWRVA